MPEFIIDQIYICLNIYYLNKLLSDFTIVFSQCRLSNPPAEADYSTTFAAVSIFNAVEMNGLNSQGPVALSILF